MKYKPILTKTDRFVHSTEDAIDMLINNSEIAFELFNEMNFRIKKLERRNTMLMLISAFTISAAAMAWSCSSDTETRVKAIEKQLKAEAQEREDAETFTFRG